MLYILRMLKWLVASSTILEMFGGIIVLLLSFCLLRTLKSINNYYEYFPNRLLP